MYTSDLGIEYFKKIEDNMKLLKHAILIIYKAKASVISLIRECLYQMTKKWDYLTRIRIVLKLN